MLVQSASTRARRRVRTAPSCRRRPLPPALPGGAPLPVLPPGAQAEILQRILDGSLPAGRPAPAPAPSYTQVPPARQPRPASAAVAAAARGAARPTGRTAFPRRSLLRRARTAGRRRGGALAAVRLRQPQRPGRARGGAARPGLRRGAGGLPGRARRRAGARLPRPRPADHVAARGPRRRPAGAGPGADPRRRPPPARPARRPRSARGARPRRLGGVRLARPAPADGGVRRRRGAAAGGAGARPPVLRAGRAGGGGRRAAHRLAPRGARRRADGRRVVDLYPVVAGEGGPAPDLMLAKASASWCRRSAARWRWAAR
jgi:hypothetical protein